MAMASYYAQEQPGLFLLLESIPLYHNAANYCPASDQSAQTRPGRGVRTSRITTAWPGFVDFDL
jgi:hypothetical protein